MKIAISCLILACLLAKICGCNNMEEPSATIFKGNNEEEVINKNLTGANVEAEEVSFVVKSAEELKSAIKNSRVSGNDNKVYSRNKLREIEYFYEPAVKFHGYELLQIEVNEHRIFYYYMPKSLMQDAESVMFDYENGIVVTVARLEGAFEDPLQPIIEQKDIKPNKDNVIFDKKHNSLTWVVDKTWVYIQFPKSFTQYEEMLSYCKVVKVMIEN